MPALAALLLAASLAAQAVAFDVASVKPSSPNPEEPFLNIEVQPGGRLIAANATLRDLVRFAYDLQDFQVDGGPGWMSSSKFDISARAPNGIAGQREIRVMLRALLADRFRLRAHTETRTVPVYELTVSARDGRLGPQLRPSMMDCAAQPADDVCRPRDKFVAGAAGATRTFVRNGLRMAQLAALLMPVVRRTVIDKTGLTETYDVELTYSPESVVFILPGAAAQTAGQVDGLSVVTAVAEQLGLRLEAGRGPW